MDEMRMGEDPRNQKTVTKFKFEWNGKKIRYYEDAVEAVMGIEDGKFDEAFHQLFPTPGMFNNYDFTSGDYDEEPVEELKKKYAETDFMGGLVFNALHKQLLSPRDMSTSTGMPQRPSAEVSLLEGDQDVLRDGFTQEYIDPHDYAMKYARRLTENMAEYCVAGVNYVAPYTSLVNSSMMGKTRLMKELSKYLPIVYMNFREKEGEFGYPPTTANLLRWFRDGAYKTLGVDRDEIDILADREYNIPTLKHSLFLLCLLENLETVVRDLLSAREFGWKTRLQSGRKDIRENFEWMWQFFSDHDDAIVRKRDEFWGTVQEAAEAKFQTLRQRHTTKTSVEGKWVYLYLMTTYTGELHEAHQQLHKSLKSWCPKLPPPITPESLTLIICFDDARHLCTSSALVEYVRDDRPNAGSDLDPVERPSVFSNFQAMRRALMFLRLADPIPRVFGLFTGTTPTRLPNSQPGPLDARNLRMLSLPEFGKDLFDPIIIFTSVDAHSRMTPQNDGISDHKKVAEVERLLKFGRAGWYSLYTGKSESSPDFVGYTKDTMREIAIAKLLGITRNEIQSFSDEVRNIGQGPLKRRMLLRLLAILAPRLALSAGRCYPEAREMVSSHLAVLVRTDKDRLLHTTFYPSEPIVAEASAAITKTIGWGPVVRALYHQIQNVIVTVGSRGELLTKVLLLMAMDDTPKPDPGDAESPYWTHTQPVKVKDFLDNWLAPPIPYRSFSEALYQNVDMNPGDDKEFQRFLDGHVFFTHFIPLDCTVSLHALVRGWNGGAAFMAKAGNDSFDHIIPVMLAGENGAPAPTFGPLHGEWSNDELKRASSNVSFILINSEYIDYDTNEDPDDDPDDEPCEDDGCVPTQYNFGNFKMINGSSVMFLSIAQDFNPHRIQRGPLVNIKGRGDEQKGLYRQLKIVLKGLGPDTYQCLRENRSVPATSDTPDHVATHGTPMEIDDKELEEDREDEDEVVGNSDRATATKYLRMLRYHNPDYLPSDLDPDLRSITVDTLSLAFAGTPQMRKEVQEAWRRLRSEMADE